MLPDSDSTHSAPKAHPTASDSAELWLRLSTLLEQRLGSDNFNRWFGECHAEFPEQARMVLHLPNPIHHFWIETNYAAALADACAEVLGVAAAISYEVAPQEHATANSGRASSGGTLRELLAARSNSGATLETPRLSAGVVAEEPTSPRTLAEAGLNARFSFESFVIGSNCSYSAAVARAVAEKPGRIYNPLFFHGPSGLGKTHLMQAIGREVLMRKKRATVRYVTSEQFTNEFIEAIQRNGLSQFRQKYRKVDVLLIDDVHFLAGKDSTQEEFFHTFNSLFDSQRQIVLASDRPPSEIKNLESRLVSRFEWGLTTQIQLPDFETRIAILKRKMQDYNATLEPWILEFIAQRIRSNIRRLEGALMRVAAHFSLEGGIGNEAALTQLLHDVLDQEPTRSITVDRVQRAVATEYDLRISDLTGPRRPKNIAEARQVAMYLTRQLIKLPLIQIGEEFGGRDHGTVIHACKVVSQRLRDQGEFRNLIDRVQARLLNA
jgi:chromosomal replication initiator protein